VAPWFKVARPLKTHYLVDPAAGAYQPSRHHRYEIRRAAQRGVEVRSVALHDILGEWSALYAELIALRGITGVQRFGPASFAALADCEGVSATAAFMGTELVSCHLWVKHGSVVWSHLAASSARGYANGATYAVYDWALRAFAGHVVNLGGAAGHDDGVSGLARFKSGFSNRVHQSWLLGQPLDVDAYARLCNARNRTPTDYFPAYRAP
jgi:hypothetical protein